MVKKVSKVKPSLRPLRPNKVLIVGHGALYPINSPKEMLNLKLGKDPIREDASRLISGWGQDIPERRQALLKGRLCGVSHGRVGGVWTVQGAQVFRLAGGLHFLGAHSAAWALFPPAVPSPRGVGVRRNHQFWCFFGMEVFRGSGDVRFLGPLPADKAPWVPDRAAGGLVAPEGRAPARGPARG